MVLQTTAHALAFAFGVLALYPDVQLKVFEEVRSLVASGGLPVSLQLSLATIVISDTGLQTYADVCHMKYTEAVFHETLRQYPPVSPTPRL